MTGIYLVKNENTHCNIIRHGDYVIHGQKKTQSTPQFKEYSVRSDAKWHKNVSEVSAIQTRYHS